MSKEQELLPCPFCGCEPDAMNEFDIHCENPFCEAQPNVAGQSPGEARAAWNQRAPMEVLSKERIDHIADLVVRGMPDGLQGFTKVWGWQQFAHALLDVCKATAPALASPAAEPVQALTDEQIEDCIDSAIRLFNGRRQGPCGQTLTTYDDWKYWLARAIERAHGIGLASPPATKEAKAGWVLTSERLPKPGDVVLGFYPSVRAAGYWNYAIVEYRPGESPHGWCNPEDEDDYFVPPDFWMPLPPAPAGAA